MKKHIPIIMLLCFATLISAQNNFENQWKEVEKLEDEGLTKSAAEVVESIYQKALSQNKTQQRIKALLYKSKYMLILEEEAQLKIVQLFDSEINATDLTITKHLLQNMLATMYWQYFQQHRYQFYNRSKTSKKVNDDFRTWDLQTLFAEIHNYYQCSLEDEELLQNESLENYSVLLNEAEDSKNYRPTLYDLLSHNALQFYKTDENSITKPTYQFKLDNEKFLSKADTFVNLNLASQGSLSLQLNALKIYQDLLKFHQRDAPSLAFVNVDIERLNFVSEHAVFPNVEEKLLTTLKGKASELKDSELSALYNFEIASVYRNQGNQYNYRDAENDSRWKLKKALDLCNKVISEFPKSEGAQKCKVLKQQILRPTLRLTAEEFIPISKPSRVLVNYKNLNSLQFNIYKVSQSQLKTFNSIYRDDEKAKFFKKLNPVETFSSNLKNEGDYQEHSTEIILPKLQNGLYLIKVETQNEHNVFATSHIQVTNLALVESQTNKNVVYQLINRNNGKPITETEVNIQINQNNNRTYSETKRTDRFGKFEIEKSNSSYKYAEIKVTFNDDVAHFGSYYISRNYNRNQNEKATQYHNFLFADRSIYRPGQTVYFKGIATFSENDKSQINPNQAVKIRLKNVNGEVVSELSSKTNAYGSVSGEFILPNDGLTGNYTIDMFCGNYGYTNFSVEEYKRPKFKPEFEPITETFKVNDSITVHGKAVAFAGSNITDGKVVYTVKRKVRYPRWYYWSRPYFNSEPQEISFGETQTNDKGEFEITFKAIPDESVSKESLPIFNYEVTADVTDLNGETRSVTTIVNVGYHAMTLNIAIPQQIDKTQKEVELTLESQNLNGEFVPTKGILKIYKLIAPEQVLRPRPWESPDYQVLSKEEFKDLFPHEAYKDESDLRNWEKGKAVFSIDFDTEKQKTILLKNIKKWESGAYAIITESEDKFGQEIKDEVITTLFSDKDKTVADQQLFTMQLNKPDYKINSVAKLTIGSAAKDIMVTVEIEKNQKIILTQLIELNDSKETISIPVGENDLGGFVVQCSFSSFNAFVSRSTKINVPYPKTDLEIETTTFRDKLQPGQDETWSFKIKGPKGEKVSAELLASMYDASLDEFKSHNWNFNPINNPSYYGQIHKNSNQSFGITNFRLFNRFENNSAYPTQSFDRLNWFGFYFGNQRKMLLRGNSLNEIVVVEESMEMEAPNANISASLSGQAPGLKVNDSVYFEEDGRFANSENLEDPNYYILMNKAEIVTNEEFQIRKNLNETAFFFPQLTTDKEGNVSFNFTVPEALTKWKLQLLAHTKTLESTVTQLEAVTQKELMVIPNAPRFLREGDQITISTKIANLTDNQLSGVAQLELINPLSGEKISNDLIVSKVTNSNVPETKNFIIDANGNTQVSWSLSIPEGLQAVQYKIIAKAGDFSDGEQNALPVLSNRMLVTETLPMWVRSNETRTFTLDKLASRTSASASKTLTNHKLTLEMTSNPAWYAVQALPYLMEYPYDCNEQTFARYYSNTLAQHIVKSNPKIEAVFNQWKSSDVLLSNLEKNQELKSLLIQETPWLRDAQSENEQKKRIGLLFDLNRMNNELKSSILKLKNNQYDSGAWPWFNGGTENRFITQHIISGLGHLKKLNVIQSESEESQMIQNAIQYLDQQFIKTYKDLRKYDKDVDLSKDHLSSIQLHYLYARSFYPEINTSKELEAIITYYENQIENYWLKRSLYAKGLMALVMHRSGKTSTARKIIKSLEENSVTSDELGMYWKSNTNSWYWHQAPIETQSLLIEAFSEVGNTIQSADENLKDIDNMKIWLLKNKQTNKWETTKATTEAVYALLLQGSDWLDATEMVDVKVGGKTIDPSTLEDVKLEAGTGYYKTSWSGKEITPNMAEVTISKKDKGIAWGAMYWQYFKDLDKITSAETPLKLSKKLFLKKNTTEGEVISEITQNTKLKVGDLVRIRIELSTDRDMEFIHLKDMRAAGFEPINVLSQYKWQDGLGYYESTKDAATNFFIDFLPKGIYIFEYDLRVNNAGDMSNGISTIQSMYAPEFSSHSEGIRIKVE